MTRLNSALVALLVILVLAVVTLSALPVRAQLPGRNNTPVGNGEWEVLGVLEWQPSTGLLRLRPLATPTPDAPGATPSPTPSATPSPTLTPTPTVTPSPPPASPTPTQEVTALPPTLTTTPEPYKVCVVKTGSFGINERSDHSTSAPRIDVIPPGSIVTVEEFWQGSPYLWARSAIGWFVVREGTTWWVYGLDQTELCDEVPGWPAGLAPPTAIAGTSWGVWIGQGANVSEALAMGDVIKAAGRTPAATVYAYKDIAAQLAAAGWDVAFRPAYGDCPDMTIDPAVSARQRWQDAMRLAAGVPYRWLILNNECVWPDVHWYRAYLDETITLAVADGKGRGLVPHVAGAGAYELIWYGVLYDAHRRLRDIGGAYGTNMYPVYEGVNLCSSDPRVQWTTYRYELYADSLPPGLPIVITEFARSWGELPPDWDDITCFARRVDGWPVAFATAWYAATPLSPWLAASLRGKLAELAEALRRALQ